MKSSTSTIVRLLPEFETLNQVIGRRKEFIRALEGGAGAATDLARMLEECADGEPCNSPICPVCVRALRTSFVLGVNKRVAKIGQAHNLPITAFSAIPIGEKHKIGKLHRADLLLFNKCFQRRCHRARLPLVFAGFDISLNEDSRRRQKNLFWQLQVYGVAVGADGEAVKQALKHFYPPDRSTYFILSSGSSRSEREDRGSNYRPATTDSSRAASRCRFKSEPATGLIKCHPVGTASTIGWRRAAPSATSRSAQIAHSAIMIQR
jgi:hypothetical protein